MRALTVKQPFADAIIYGGKDIENRSWRTPYRGWLLIHAAAERPIGAYLKDAQRRIEAAGVTDTSEWPAHLGALVRNLDHEIHRTEN